MTHAARIATGTGIRRRQFFMRLYAGTVFAVIAALASALSSERSVEALSRSACTWAIATGSLLAIAEARSEASFVVSLVHSASFASHDFRTVRSSATALRMAVVLIMMFSKNWRTRESSSWWMW